MPGQELTWDYGADYTPRDYPCKYDAMVIRQALHARHALPSRNSRHPDARAFVAARAEQTNQLKTNRGEEPPRLFDSTATPPRRRHASLCARASVACSSLAPRETASVPFFSNPRGSLCCVRSNPRIRRGRVSTRDAVRKLFVLDLQVFPFCESREAAQHADIWFHFLRVS